MRLPIILMLGATMGLIGCASQPVSTTRSQDGVTATEPDRYQIRFSHRDRMLIRDYFRRNPLDPAAGQRLPPDLEQRLFQRGTLPPGLSAHALPAELEQRLSPVPDTLARRRVGENVLLWDRESRMILDIIRDIEAK